MISPELTKLLKANSTYYKCKNKTEVIQKRLDYLNRKKS